ncbi:MAG: LysE family translocator [Aeromonas sp.]
MPISLFVTVGLLHLVALISPGADFALILRCSAHRATALAAALGIALAIALHATLSVTGISLLIAQHEWLFNLIKAFGAGYLAWLGLGALQAARQAPSASAAPNVLPQVHGKRAGLQAGLVTNLLNPKALLFFIGLLAALVTPEVSDVSRALLVLELFVLALGWFSLLAWGLSLPAVQVALQRLQRPFNALIALLFLTVSLSIGQDLWHSL